MELLYKNTKIVVFDFNINNLKFKEVNSIATSIFKVASKNQHAILLCSSSFIDGIAFCEENNIDSGFLSCDNGAIIYDLSKSEFLRVKTISSDDTLAICHYGLMGNYSIYAASIKKQFIYDANFIASKQIFDVVHKELEIFNNYKLFLELVLSKEINSIKFYAGDSIPMTKIDTLCDIIAETTDVNAKIKQHNLLYCMPRNTSGYKTIYELMNLLNIPDFNNIFYYAVSNYDEECHMIFKNSIIEDKLLANKEITDFKKVKVVSKDFSGIDMHFGAKTNGFWQ